MRKKSRNKTDEICSFCSRPGVIDVRRDKLYKGVLIENLPAKQCPHCHEVYFDLDTAQLMEKIAREPDRYARLVKRPVARVA
jgi:YgiT-type zinc finger domain-containing protein